MSFSRKKVVIFYKYIKQNTQGVFERHSHILLKLHTMCENLHNKCDKMVT